MALVESGAIESDPAQMQIVERVASLGATVADFYPPAKGSALGWLMARKPAEPPPSRVITR